MEFNGTYKPRINYSFMGLTTIFMDVNGICKPTYSWGQSCENSTRCPDGTNQKNHDMLFTWFSRAENKMMLPTKNKQ